MLPNSSSVDGRSPVLPLHADWRRSIDSFRHRRQSRFMRAHQQSCSPHVVLAPHVHRLYPRYRASQCDDIDDHDGSGESRLCEAAVDRPNSLSVRELIARYALPSHRSG